MNNMGRYLQEYQIGDYVYYDKKLKYNNTIGKKVGICVNDDVNNQLFISISKIRYQIQFPLAKSRTHLYFDKKPKFSDGWEATQYILDNYKNDIKNTAWDILDQNEYIPSLEELKIIADNRMKNPELFKDIKFYNVMYWSSSLTNIMHNALGLFFDDCSTSDDNIRMYHYVIPLLHIDN